jgi:hypothetical protein
VGVIMAKFSIKTKSKIYSGITEGIVFTDGQAIIEDETIKSLSVVNYGYTAELIEDEANLNATLSRNILYLYFITHTK